MTEPLPTGIQLTPFDSAFQRDPHAVLDRLREEAPTLRDEQLKRWFLTRHDDVRAVLRDKELWSDPRKANPDSFVRMVLAPDDNEPSMLFMDDPGHRRLRGLINKAFTPKAVDAMRPRVRAIADELLNAVTADEFDLIEALAAPLPVVVIAEMLGLDPNDHASFKRWSDTAVSTFFNPFRSADDNARAEAAGHALDAVFQHNIDARRRKPGADLISAMVLAEEDGDRMTDAEIISQCNLLLIAGNVTTTDLIGNGVKALLDHPDELAKLRRRPELLANAVEEMLRYDSPVTQSGRTANREMTIGGCPIHKGESISVSLAAANHDPAIHPEPHRFDIERQNPSHESFGGGRHFCLGAPLARVEAQETIAALLARYPRLTPAPRPLQYRTIPGFRGLSAYWVGTADA
jgi:cytochrome P450